MKFWSCQWRAQTTFLAMLGSGHDIILEQPERRRLTSSSNLSLKPLGEGRESHAA